MGANRNTEQRYKLFIYLLSIIKKQILLTVNNKQILLTVSKKQILLTVSKKQIFCVSIVSTLLLLAIFPLAKNRHPNTSYLHPLQWNDKMTNLVGKDLDNLKTLAGKLKCKKLDK